MIKKRLSTTVVIRDDLAVQSFSFKKYLPIGKPEIVIENLSWWGSDEILIFDLKSKLSKQEPNFSIIDKICEKKLSTPITYSGRINNPKDAVKVINSGVERVGMGNIIFNNSRKMQQISDMIGSQAVILILNCLYIGGKLYLRDLINNKSIPYSEFETKIESLSSFYSEIMIVDIQNEGSCGNFDLNILHQIKLNKKLILYGGMYNFKKINKCLKNKMISSIAIGNQFYFHEHAYQELKNKLKSNLIRPQFYNN